LGGKGRAKNLKRRRLLIRKYCPMSDLIRADGAFLLLANIKRPNNVNIKS